MKKSERKQIFLEARAPQASRQQVAVLPFRCTPELEILLVSSLESRRWIIPKGWPMKGRTLSEAAAREAFEEAGIKGVICEEPAGTFVYDKRKRNGAVWRCEVEVFALEVQRQSAKWPEKTLRTHRWCDWREAAELVDDPGLADVIRAFAARPLKALSAA